MAIDSKMILKIMEHSEPKQKSNCLGIFMLFRSKLTPAFDLKTYYDADGLVCELVPRGKVQDHEYVITIRPKGK